MGRECKQLGYVTRVLAMDGYPITQLPEEKVVLFAVSTTGQVWSVRLPRGFDTAELITRAHVWYRASCLRTCGPVGSSCCASRYQRPLCRRHHMLCSG
jgi:hypothetical protein